jgi:uridine kinase
VSDQNQLENLVDVVVAVRRNAPMDRAILIGLSGIDGSGKSFLANEMDQRLRGRGHNVATITADDWLNLPAMCISPENPGAHFYKHAMRLDEMFGQLSDPLMRDRHIDLLADCGDAKATANRKHRYLFDNVDIVLLEGIFIFKPAYGRRFDLKIWIDCSFETAMERAIARGQEGLPPDETRRAFETIYFPAQRIHMEADRPRDAAHYILQNDSL